MRKQQVEELIAALDRLVAALRNSADHIDRMRYALVEQQKKGTL